jgi:hypothetical protein
VAFREIKDVIFKQDFLPREKEPKKIEFELKDDESDYTEEKESKEEEPHTPVLRRLVQERRKLERYTPLDFCSHFYFFVTNYDIRTIREAMDLEYGKLWKNDMVEEMVAFDKNEAWDLVEFLVRRNTIGSKWVFKKKLNVGGEVDKYKA